MDSTKEVGHILNTSSKLTLLECRLQCNPKSMARRDTISDVAVVLVDVGIHDTKCLLILLYPESSFSFLRGLGDGAINDTEGLVCVEGRFDVLLPFSVVGGPPKLGDLIEHNRDTRCNHGESRDRNE